MQFLPKVLLVGGPDIDLRLELMDRLANDFDISAMGSDSALQERFMAAGFHYTSYRLGPRANPLIDLLGMSQLVSLFRRLAPHIVHTFATKPSVWGRLAARLAGVPIIIGTLPGLGSLYASDDFITSALRIVYQPLQKLACRSSDLTIFQNEDDFHQFVTAGVVSEKKAMIIPGSGVSSAFFSPTRVSSLECTLLRDELDIKLDETVVTMISRVNRTKGVFEFMAAALETRAAYSNVHFLLIGPEDQGVDRLTAAELAHLRQKVTWPGPRRDIRTVLAMSDIFVLPSTYREGVPRVLLEAASMELPIVTTNSPGCKEVVKNNVNGFLVPVRNSAALSQAILRLVEQPELRRRFGQASRQYVEERFDLAVVGNHTCSVYRHLLASKGLVWDGLQTLKEAET
jgi:glycosyltransferase involved in cell wall biosynthesis